VARNREIRLEDSLVLHGWVNSLSGYGSMRELLNVLK
jgi:hypothetical protein